MNRKIAIISEGEPGGIGTYSIELVKALKNRKINAENLFINKGNTLESLKNIAKKCKNYNLIHIQHDYNEFGRGSIFFTSFLNEIKKNYSGKLIITMHTVRSLKENLGRLSGVKKFVFNFMNKKIKENFDLIIVHTNSSKEILIKEYGFPERKIKIIPMWAPEIGVVKENQVIKGLKSEKKKVVLCWGFISPHKNYESVIKAVKKIPEEINLIIAGSAHPNSLNRDKKYILFLRGLSNELRLQKRVIFLEKFLHQNEMDSLIFSSDLVVLPYKTITTSAVFYRSLALKKPILASNIAFFKEINKKYGYPKLFHSEEDLPKQISNLLENKKDKNKIISGLKKCLSSSNLRNLAKDYEKIYSKLFI